MVLAAARLSARACIGASPVRRTTHVPAHWTVRHFSQANPADPGCESVPAVLRRLAASIEALGFVEIQDVVIESELTEHGPWRSGTFDFHLPEDEH